MTKFNVGDKVKVTDPSIPKDYKIKYGETYTVTETYANRLYVEGFTDFYYDSRFSLDNLASTIASVRAGDRVTVRTKRATYAEFEVGSHGYGIIGSKGGEVAVSTKQITELTITKPALPTEPGVGAIVKFTKLGKEYIQFHSGVGWFSLYTWGEVSSSPYDWEKTLKHYGFDFEVIREGKK